MSNAVKFCAERDGRIRLEAWREAQFLRLDVTDNGIGIARQDQEKIFERFQQAGNTLTDKPQGTGLGLPICREILRRFGGDIWVESEPGKGATFSFRVPVARPSRGRRVAAPIAANQLASSQRFGVRRATFGASGAPASTNLRYDQS